MFTKAGIVRIDPSNHTHHEPFDAVAGDGAV